MTRASSKVAQSHDACLLERVHVTPRVMSSRNEKAASNARLAAQSPCVSSIRCDPHAGLFRIANQRAPA
ncbi:hypothetical protein DIE11_25230 [Burkholderia sp. Bp9012]|nr:hypothetical protein DIE11_25230 [Burkholderia sp. Bp9012]